MQLTKNQGSLKIMKKYILLLYLSSRSPLSFSCNNCLGSGHHPHPGLLPRSALQQVLGNTVGGRAGSVGHGGVLTTRLTSVGTCLATLVQMEIVCGCHVYRHLAVGSRRLVLVTIDLWGLLYLYL